jgi:hypothetical protein
MQSSAATDDTLKWIAVSLQVFGISLTLLGLVVVRSWLESATGVAGRGLRRWWRLRREGLRRRRADLGRWRVRRRGRPAGVPLSMSAGGTSSATATVTASRPRVDRATVSDRDWLAYLDDHVEALHVRSTEAATARAADRAELADRIAAQRQQLRDEMLRSTRDGWQLIAAGLVLSAVGIVLGGLA